MTLTRSEIRTLAEIIMQRYRKTDEKLDDLPKSARREWIDAAYEIEDGYNMIVRAMREGRIQR